MGQMMTNTASLWSDIGCAEELIIQYDQIALQDHSYVTTWQERSQNEKSWTISLNAEGIQAPLNQRSDFKEAKPKYLTNMQQSLEMEANHISSWATSQATA